jgi:hypothetical protein
MVTLTCPDHLTLGEPISVAFEATERVAGRVRLTSGTEALTFRLERAPDQLGDPAAGHRVRGRKGSFRIVEWGDHPVGTELVLRFEAEKKWMTVTG